jgi:hypothetical protein
VRDDGVARRGYIADRVIHALPVAKSRELISGVLASPIAASGGAASGTAHEVIYTSIRG